MIKMTLSVLTVALLVCSCGESKAGGCETSEQLMAEYKKCHEAKGEGVIGLIYQQDKMTDQIKQMLKMTISADADQKIKSITIEDYDDSRDALMAEALKKQGLKIPVKPTNMLKISYEDSEGATGSSTEIPMAKVDGSYYLIAPIKAE